ncbi:MAG: hypothetical protein LBD78_11320 [Spirochaetaceae bacterium]|jgi:hypothetical protein|nr:hypothetical protein [Spirochaetaceae bacterium]
MAGGDRAAFSFPSLPILIMLGILLVLIIALIVFLIARRLHGNPTKAMAYAMGRSVPHKEDALPRPPVENKENAEFLASYAAKQRKGSRISGAKPMVLEKTEAPTPPIGNIMVSLFVEDQNTAIGRRNIHNLKPGNTYTIGGGASDFLIFLVPIPPRIAELRYDGRQCTFVPRRPEFFPDTGSQPVNDCIGKTIRVVSEKNYELFIRAEWYQDPIISLNRLLNSVNLPV